MKVIKEMVKIIKMKEMIKLKKIKEEDHWIERVVKKE
jgi:hypothetical protein